MCSVSNEPKKLSFVVVVKTTKGAFCDHNIRMITLSVLLYLVIDFWLQYAVDPCLYIKEFILDLRTRKKWNISWAHQNCLFRIYMSRLLFCWSQQALEMIYDFSPDLNVDNKFLHFFKFTFRSRRSSKIIYVGGEMFNALTLN